MSIAPAGSMYRSAHAPTATPPASVEFWMCTMSRRRLSTMDRPNVVMTHAHSDSSVLAMARMRWLSVVVTALNDGHMIHRNSVPGVHTTLVAAATE